MTQHIIEVSEVRSISFDFAPVRCMCEYYPGDVLDVDHRVFEVRYDG